MYVCVYVCMSMCVGISLPGPESFRREAWARKSLCCAGEWLGNPHVTLVGLGAHACAAEGSPSKPWLSQTVSPRLQLGPRVQRRSFCACLIFPGLRIESLHEPIWWQCWLRVMCVRCGAATLTVHSSRYRHPSWQANGAAVLGVRVCGYACGLCMSHTAGTYTRSVQVSHGVHVSVPECTHTVGARVPCEDAFLGMCAQLMIASPLLAGEWGCCAWLVLILLKWSRLVRT